MHVQNVYAKAVAFLKGAVAQVARELSVSLVNTPCVLEVLVAVVLVSKHLATTVARVVFSCE